MLNVCITDTVFIKSFHIVFSVAYMVVMREACQDEQYGEDYLCNPISVLAPLYFQ